MAQGSNSYRTEFRTADQVILTIDLSKMSEGYGAKTYHVKVRVSLVAAWVDAKKQTVSTLMYIKVHYRTKSQGTGQSVWRVGVSEVSDNPNVQKAYQDIQTGMYQAFKTSGKQQTKGAKSMVFKVWVIGLGAMGRAHMYRLTNVLTGAVVMSVTDMYQEAAQAAVRDFKLNAKVYPEVTSCLKDPDMYAVLLFSLCGAQVATILKALDTDKFIFTEKPCATTL